MAFYEKDARTERLVIKPKTGKAGFFYGQQYHEGRRIEKGEKYLLRTDLMIRQNKGPSQTTIMHCGR